MKSDFGHCDEKEVKRLEHHKVKHVQLTDVESFSLVARCGFLAKLFCTSFSHVMGMEWPFVINDYEQHCRSYTAEKLSKITL